MSDLTDALNLLTDGPLLRRIDRHNADRFVQAVATVTAALADASERDWCQTHFCTGQSDWCWAWVAGAAPREPCRMVRKLLVDP